MKKIAILLAAFGLLGLLAVPNASAQQDDLFGDVCDQRGAGSSPACKDTSGDDPLTGEGGVIVRIINVAAVVGGIIAVIIIMYGGFQYITSGGNSNKTTEARETILYAAIGLAVIVLAQAIVSFVLTRIL